MPKTLPEQVQHERIIETPERRLVLPISLVGKILRAETTPSVKNVEHWIAQNASAVTITNFMEGQEGQNLFILGDGQTTLQHGGNIVTLSGADTLLAADKMYQLKRMNNKWFQIQGQEASTLSISWGSVTGTPTTLAGYGVTDAYTKAETDTLLAAKADSATTLAGYGITDAYTKSEVDALLAALTTGDLTDWPADAAGVLTNDGAGTLTWEAAGGGASALDDLSDVVITTPTTKDVLAYDGTDWDNTAIDASYVNPGTFPDGDFTFGDQYIIKNVLNGTGQALAALAKEEFHFSGHQTADNVQGISWSYGSVPGNAQAKVIVQMSGSYGSKMYLMTTNSFATGAQTAMLIDHLGVVSINRTTGKLIPGTNGVQALGDSSHLWDAVYSEKYFAESGGSAPTCGSASIGAGDTTVTVNTTAVTANSRIFITPIGTLPTADNIFFVSAITAGSSFVIKRFGTATNSGVIHWFLVDEV